MDRYSFVNRGISNKKKQKNRKKMLGGGGSQGNGAFSSASSALPPARRHHHHHQQTAATTTAACWKANNPFNSLSGSVVVPSTASEEATVAHQQHQQQQPTVQHQRKRPGCLCDHYDDDDEEEEESISLVRHCYNQVDSTVQPLDLSLPKVKVRQHWSGGSIVQVNDSTIISINSAGGGRGGAECCGCPASTGASSTTGSSPLLASSRLNVSVVTVPQQPCWPAGNNNTLPIDRHHPHHQQPQPFRLQIEIPFVADKLSGFFRQQQQQHHHHHRRKSSNNSTSLLRPPEVAAAATNVMTDEEDDLQRLSDSAHQLRLSGYYYGHLTWKDSIQLLQNTKVNSIFYKNSTRPSSLDFFFAKNDSLFLASLLERLTDNRRTIFYSS